jgi:PAS domain S-box-containing protein
MVGEQLSVSVRDDIARVTLLPDTWKDLGATAFAESVLMTLVDMLGLEFAGIRFTDDGHTFLRMGGALATESHSESVLASIDDLLERGSRETPNPLTICGHQILSVVRPLGRLVSLGYLIVGSRRPDFPDRDELLRLDLMATQTSLACREMRELNEQRIPMDMRENKPTGEALAESERRLTLTINTIPALAWSATSDGLLDFVNEHFLDVVGYTFEEIEGVNFYKIFHPDDVQYWVSTWQEIMAEKKGRELEGRLRCADGQYRWFTFRQNPLKDADGNVLKWYGVVTDIEDRRRAEQELRAAKAALVASEQNLKLIIDSLPVLAWSARPDGSADFINQRWLEYAGLPAEKILGWGFLDLYHPDDVAGMLDIWKRDLEHSDQTILKGRIRNGDGQYRWFLFAGRKLIDANGVVRWFGCNLDIDDLQRAEEALRASTAALAENEQRLKLIINTLPAFICSATPEGDVDFFNQHFLDFNGYTFDELKGQGFYKQFHPDDVERLGTIWQNILETKRPQDVDGRIRRHDGEYRWFTFRQGPLFDANGKLIKWHVVVVDIEDRKRAEEKLRQIQSDLARATRIMAMGEIAVSIAHEVNQPLMAIVTNAGTCLRWLDEAQLNLPRAREAAERIVRDGHRAGDIVSSIRTLARKSAPKLVPVDVNSMVQDVLDLLRGELVRRDINCRTEFTLCHSPVVADSTQIQQVVLNLVMNATEAMSQLEVQRRKLVVRTDFNDKDALVSVADTGSGIDVGHRERMFEAFFSTKSEGIGMGLSICRSIVEAHGGHIWASENHPHGSVFSFTLPVNGRAGFDA